MSLYKGGAYEKTYSDPDRDRDSCLWSPAFVCSGLYGTISVLDAESKLLFIVSLLAEGPSMP